MIISEIFNVVLGKSNIEPSFGGQRQQKRGSEKNFSLATNLIIKKFGGSQPHDMSVKFNLSSHFSLPQNLTELPLFIFLTLSRPVIYSLSPVSPSLSPFFPPLLVNSEKYLWLFPCWPLLSNLLEWLLRNGFPTTTTTTAVAAHETSLKSLVVATPKSKQINKHWKQREARV